MLTRLSEVSCQVVGLDWVIFMVFSKPEQF